MLPAGGTAKARSDETTPEADVWRPPQYDLLAMGNMHHRAVSVRDGASTVLTSSSSCRPSPKKPGGMSPTRSGPAEQQTAQLEGKLSNEQTFTSECGKWREEFTQKAEQDFRIEQARVAALLRKYRREKGNNYESVPT